MGIDALSGGGTHLSRQRVAGLLFLLFMALVFWSSAALQANFFDSLGMLQKFSEQNVLLAGSIFLLLAILSSLISPFSSVPLIPLAIAIFGNVVTFCLLIIGWMIGSIAAYFIGYSVGHHFFRTFFSFEKLERYRRRFSEHAQFVLVLLFRLAVPAEITGYTLGIVRYSFRKYVLAVFLSELPFALISVYSGWALLEKNFGYLALILSLGLLFVTVLSYFFHKELEREKDAQEQ